MELVRLVSRLYNYRILGAVFLIWVVLLFFPVGLVPDWLNLAKSIEEGTFTRILQSFISVFGFLVTVLILGYGFLREKFRRLALSEFLDNKYSTTLVSLFISIFLVNIFSSVLVDSMGPTRSSITIAYYALLLSIGYFIIFLPVALFSIYETDSQALLNKYVNQFEKHHFPDYPYNDLTISYDERNPIVVVSNLVRSYADKEDIHSISAVVFLTQEKIASLVGDSNDRRAIGSYLAGQRMIWDTIVFKSLQRKEFAYIETIFQSYRLYHFHFSEKRIPLLYLEELMFWVRMLVERLGREGADEPIEHILMAHDQILEHHYSHSAPLQSELVDLNEYYDPLNPLTEALRATRLDLNKMDRIDIQWNKISDGIAYVYSIVMQKAIERKNHVILRRALDSISHLILSVQGSRLGNFQKAWITRDLAGMFHVYQLNAIREGLLKDTMGVRMIDTSVVFNEIDKNTLCAKELLQSSSEFLVGLLALGKVDEEIINFYGGVGRYCSGRYALQDSYQVTLKYILKVLEHMRTEFEKDLPVHKENYSELKRTLESIMKYHTNVEVLARNEGQRSVPAADKELINQLKGFISKYKDVSTVEPTIRIPWE